MTSVNSNYEIFKDLGLTQQAETKKVESKQDQFMKLMIAQMENQDPFAEQESGQFLTQLAQFDTATGIQDLDKSFSSFSQTMQSNSALQASTLVGHNVLVPGNKGSLEIGGKIDGVVNLDATTSQLTVDVLDTAGQTIKTINLGQQLAGPVNFTWDGKDANGNILPPGKYSFNATSTVGNTKLAQNTAISSKVDSVSVGQFGQGMKLNLAGLGAVDFNQVTEIR
ncbi:MAG: flagellar hook assembly protein FlgD [Gammaproteobacteria bacterium]|nr:flagellar hook assembly protein FlgD [Gammaproteobacteria bacterium]